MECNRETYTLEGSFDEKVWTPLLKNLPRYYVTDDLLKGYAKYAFFRVTSDVTHQTLAKAFNTGHRNVKGSKRS